MASRRNSLSALPCFYSSARRFCRQTPNYQQPSGATVELDGVAVGTRPRKGIPGGYSQTRSHGLALEHPVVARNQSHRLCQQGTQAHRRPMNWISLNGATAANMAPQVRSFSCRPAAHLETFTGGSRKVSDAAVGFNRTLLEELVRQAKLPSSIERTRQTAPDSSSPAPASLSPTPTCSRRGNSATLLLHGQRRSQSSSTSSGSTSPSAKVEALRKE